MYDIVIIGAGVIGVTTAIAIQEEFGPNAKVTIYSEKLSPNTTGDISAGLWSPYLLGSTPDDKISKWSRTTFNYFHKLWKDGYANETGVSLQPAMRLWTDKQFNPSAWIYEAFGCERMTDQQLNVINREFGENYAGGISFVTFICEPTKLLPFLLKKFTTSGGNIVMKRIENFAELSQADVIVNCSGYDAKRLCNDNQMKAIRGQVTRVKAPWIFRTILDDSDDGRYVIANTECVILGGTHQVNDMDVNVRPSDTEFIFSGCYKLNPGLKNCEIIKHQVGLRPGRNEVKLEIETIDLNNGKLNIVHNYGHGGSGVTLCYGCALDALEMVNNVLGTRKYKNKL